MARRSRIRAHSESRPFLPGSHAFFFSRAVHQRAFVGVDLETTQFRKNRLRRSNDEQSGWSGELFEGCNILYYFRDSALTKA
ncbi:MAG: hypothetical protein AAFQ82_07110, partial [Myxococcota bacterium]